MVFSSVEFLFFFLPLSFAAYYLLPNRFRNAVLLLVSLVFYSWGGGTFLLVLFVSIAVDYCLGFVADFGHRTQKRLWRRWAVGSSVAVNIGLLAYFKYANFFVAEFNAATERIGLSEIAWTSVALPIGISFFTFQSMSYTIDVARGTAKHLRNPIDFAMYVALFPQLIAGPIVRFHELSQQIVGRFTTRDDLALGAIRFAHGLVKKVVVADGVAVIADAAFAARPGHLSAAAAWAGLLAYTIQIYFDFSGYSDMAIGLGKMFGFTFPENFNRPYSALSITDFWRRWHITLSNWFRDYLYLPLGGSRRGTRRTYLNLIFVFLVTGLWHGANWTFVAWGAYHGVLLILERLTGQRALDERQTLTAVRRVYTFGAAMGGWVLFRSASLPDALGYFKALVPRGGFGDLDILAPSSLSLFVLFVSLAVVLAPREFSGARLVGGIGKPSGAARLALMGVALPYAAALIVAGSFSPFLYFQF
ncbi:MAG: MBOAT family protein [Acidimicrobiia bacterium]|nr:MBOAT family protein [Acidimicrobiia bacterium]